MTKNSVEALLLELKDDLSKLLQREKEMDSELFKLKVQIDKTKISIIETEKLKRMELISNEEKIILKNLTADWKYIARDSCGSQSVFLYEEKPEFDAEQLSYDIVGESHWLSFSIYNHLFTFIKPGECYRIIDIIN